MQEIRETPQTEIYNEGEKGKNITEKAKRREEKQTKRANLETFLAYFVLVISRENSARSAGPRRTYRPHGQGAQCLRRLFLRGRLVFCLR